MLRPRSPSPLLPVNSRTKGYGKAGTRAASAVRYLLWTGGIILTVYVIAVASKIEPSVLKASGYVMGTSETEGLNVVGSLAWKTHTTTAPKSTTTTPHASASNHEHKEHHTWYTEHPEDLPQAAEGKNLHLNEGHVHHEQDEQPEALGAPTGLYAMSAIDIDGKERSFKNMMGKVTVVVNVASQCGFTDENYKGLMEVYNKYKEYGLEVLAFPSNQFGEQEPGTNSEIKQFCTSKHGVTFPLMSKVDVNGPQTHPVFAFLKKELPEHQGGGGGVSGGQDFVWNFQKVIVDQDGWPVRLHHQKFDRGALEHDIYDLLVGKRLE